jgi:predicted dehydrogenase
MATTNRAGRLGYAVVGLGRIAEHAVLPAFAHSKRSKLAAVVSRDQDKARRVAAKFGAANAYSDYAACLNDPAVEAVFITSANGAHADQTIQAAEAGKHVLCEKPMAPSVAECLKMIRACRRNRVRLMIAYRKYFEPASVALKKLVDRGKLGRLKIMHSAFTMNLHPVRSAAWHLDQRVAGGGSLVDVGVYCVNTARWIAGRSPAEARAYQWTVDPKRFREVDENIAFDLIFPGGLVVQASSSFAAAQASFLHVHGERGWAALDPAYAYNEERRLFGQIDRRWFETRFPILDEFALELDAFAQCVRSGRDPEPDGWEGLRDVAIMEAIYEAARTNQAVRIRIPKR